MIPVIFHQDAEAELKEAIAYYERQRAGLGISFQTEVEEAVQLIQQNPRRFPRHHEFGLRGYQIKRFPYTIFYLELDEAAWIVAVAHQRRRPRYWAHRISM
ncbi:type II toxin-antitoxin system RelE/ParE family toxin [Candidatus Entotheonella palauensis]|uniref:type II toxin-antitoxin system RelE/ParE family toxin n=1 Tax=Candidatus Entotheonella palauensis TaxID=93172 RepID=UPI000B7E0E9C|nr:type II toxin-antitoxin system RelE/ParE family toxin [Candidatus Entotheonella palauensis]